MPNCLNCGAELHGPFCSGCGQRVVPRYPTLREMASDAWHEFSGWDGRFARTLRMLIHPGVLTLEVLEGRRARYVSPLRLYLAASVMFFLISAAAPSLRRPQTVELPGGGKKIDLLKQLSPEDRALAQQQIVSVAGILMFVVLVVYALKAFRRVYQERWVWILLKSAAIAPLYAATLVVGMIGTYAWTLLT
jgi:hypothetical protein